MSATYGDSTLHLRQFPCQLLSYFLQWSYLLGPLHFLTALLFKCTPKHIIVRHFQPLPKDTCVCTEFVVCLCHISLHIPSKEQRKLVLVFINEGLIQLINVFHPLGRMFRSCVSVHYLLFVWCQNLTFILFETVCFKFFTFRYLHITNE